MSDRVLSVIIPTFNAANLLPATIEHVIDLASGPGFAAGLAAGAVEIIVVDDGSTDETSELLDRFATLGLVRAVRQQNRGVAAARNAGIRAASASVIGMLDVDDRWTSAIFDVLLPSMAEPEGPAIVQGRLRDLWDEGLGPAYESINLGSGLFRRSLFDDGDVGPFDERLRRLEDYEWLTRAYDLRIPKRRFDCVTLKYRRGPDGLTARAPDPDPLFVRVHRDTLIRRRTGLAHLPAGFPSVKEYFGVPPSEADRRPSRATRDSQTADLRRLDSDPVDDAATVRGFMCVRNECLRLPAALRHQREIGVSEFFVIDNGSTDGSIEWLLAQPDVHVWQTTDSFAESRFGTDWMLSLLADFGVDRWCTVVDADELLVYPGVGQISLPDFCATLDREGANAMLAIMVDLYPHGVLRDAVYRSGDDPLNTCRWFDRKVWTQQSERFAEHQGHESFFGGVRQRVFGAPTVGNKPDDGCYFTLNKVPLFRYNPAMRISPSFHWMDSAHMSSSRGAILHWKFTANLEVAAVHEISRGEHWDGASQYRRYADALTGDPSFALFDAEHSVEYQGPDQLEDLGILRASSVPEPLEVTR